LAVKKSELEPIQHLELRHPLSLETWRETLLGMDASTFFHTHNAVFNTAHAFGITAELKQIIDDFGERARAATYAVRNRMIEAVWIDPSHNYMAIAFTKASGDPEDTVLTLSLYPRRGEPAGGHGTVGFVSDEPETDGIRDL